LISHIVDSFIAEEGAISECHHEEKARATIPQDTMILPGKAESALNQLRVTEENGG